MQPMFPAIALSEMLDLRPHFIVPTTDGWRTFVFRPPKRLKWTLSVNMRDVQAGVAEVKYWGKRDSNLVGIYTPQVGPGGKLLDNPDFHPLYDIAQDLELPLLVHPGTGRPPYTPGSLELNGSWFLIQSLLNPWAGMTAMATLVGGGVLDLFPKLRVAVIETSGGVGPRDRRPPGLSLPGLAKSCTQFDTVAK